MVTAEASHTHLFPGAVLVVTGEGPSLVVRFSDGASVAAEIVDDGGKPALVMEAYTTGAGTVIPRKMWFLRSLESEGGERRLKVGRSVALG
ncbi:hypothetical protein SAMN04487912_106107 [Arthrobacter sp. cf158]|uniref:hypothetical protein n=1 Tax=Arthrobacter sp. cf158 TaxID=1761744 RepID=UPI00089AA5D4|nr:hypothetical protein [Arthrobacter sp. cf158]SDW98508.1 hypothetical protein SAMN04487912_106107 [Arthrobacter sp. cf158]